MYYVHKHEVALQYGGPEEGGWWFTSGTPTGFSLGPIEDEENAYAQSRALNNLEDERREKEERFEFTSVLAHQSRHFSFGVYDEPTPTSFPQHRPHYE